MHHDTNSATQPPRDQSKDRILLLNVRYKYSSLHYAQIHDVKSAVHSMTNKQDDSTIGGQGIKAPECSGLRIKLPSGTTITAFIIPKVAHTLMSARRRLVNDCAMDILQGGSPLFERHVPTLLEGLTVKLRLESVATADESIG